ncbi:uncharacterized protein [Dermacentor andersoni]|uniref:uncharacterized protein n=1 Tax=Dermacentor andersoni TaxID=34620 RepID=UPI0021553F40|nr:uncharacterized protein LOC126532371 [Dermacentor andersoni]
MTPQLLLVATLAWCLVAPAHTGIILTGVAPGYEPEQPSFMYTNFGVVFGTRELQKQYQFNSATDEINHHHTDIVGTRGRIRENVTPYQGDPNRRPTHTVDHSRKKKAAEDPQAWPSGVSLLRHMVPAGVVWIV